MAAAVRGAGDPRTVTVRLEGEHVTVTRGTEYRHVWRDVIAVEEDARGGRKVIAVGGTREDLARDAPSAEQRLLERVRFSRPLDPATFDPDLAVAFLAYVVRVAIADLPWWRRLWTPPFAVEIPGYEQLAIETQLAFEAPSFPLGRPSLVNGRRARRRERWLAGARR